MDRKFLSIMSIACGVFALVPASEAAGIQVGPSGKTYASASLECALHPVAGWSPRIQAGLYAPGKKASASVALNGSIVARVTYASPDAIVWLPEGVDEIAVSPGKRVTDRYVFDASPTWPGQPNTCIPDTSGNTISGDLEFAQSQKSYATVTPGCAFNPQVGHAQAYVTLFDNGTYLLNVSINGTALTQLNGTTRRQVPVFLSAGLNVLSAANGALSTDDYVRDGGTGTCQLP